MQRSVPEGPASSPNGFALRVRSLARAAARSWRILRTGASFVIAGLLCLLLTLVIFPIVRLLPGTHEEKEIRSQRWVHRVVRILFGVVALLHVMKLRCNDAERLKQPGVLVVANHPTLIDALCLMSLMPQADCVVKASHYHNAFLSGPIKAAGSRSNSTAAAA